MDKCQIMTLWTNFDTSDFYCLLSRTASLKRSPNGEVGRQGPYSRRRYKNCTNCQFHEKVGWIVKAWCLIRKNYFHTKSLHQQRLLVHLRIKTDQIIAFYFIASLLNLTISWKSESGTLPYFIHYYLLHPILSKFFQFHPISSTPHHFSKVRKWGSSVFVMVHLLDSHINEIFDTFIFFSILLSGIVVVVLILTYAFVFQEF